MLQSGSSSGAQIKLANNVMTQDVLDRMYEALKFTNYYPFSLNWNGNPAVEAGDWLTVEDLQGNEFKVPNMSYTLTYNGGLTTTSKADTSVSSPATYSYGGSMRILLTKLVVVKALRVIISMKGLRIRNRHCLKRETFGISMLGLILKNGL